ncbi:MAG TPA: hypothetical protein VFV66_31160 [Nonomuraea sp.]|nr:hypothetical protein [Nonomuraea sp.]
MSHSYVVTGGCAAAVRRFLTAGIPGAIVNLTSRPATRAVPGSPQEQRPTGGHARATRG